LLAKTIKTISKKTGQKLSGRVGMNTGCPHLLPARRGKNISQKNRLIVFWFCLSLHCILFPLVPSGEKGAKQKKIKPRKHTQIRSLRPTPPQHSPSAFISHLTSLASETMFIRSIPLKLVIPLPAA
jgi:hypothetical protein